MGKFDAALSAFRLAEELWLVAFQADGRAKMTSEAFVFLGCAMGGVYESMGQDDLALEKYQVRWSHGTVYKAERCLRGCMFRTFDSSFLLSDIHRGTAPAFTVLIATLGPGTFRAYPRGRPSNPLSKKAGDASAGLDLYTLVISQSPKRDVILPEAADAALNMDAGALAAVLLSCAHFRRLIPAFPE